MASDERQKQIANYVAQLRDAGLKSTWDPNFVAKHLRQGGYFHDLVGVYIDPKYIKDVYKNISDKDLYGDTLWNGEQRNAQDRNVQEKGLKDYIGQKGSKERKAIEQAQDKHLSDLNRQNMVYDLGKGRYVTPEEAGGPIFKSPERQDRESDKSKQMAEGKQSEKPVYDDEEADQDDKNKRGFKDFESSATKADQWQKGMSTGSDIAKGAGQAATQGATTTGSGAAATGAAAAGAGAATGAAATTAASAGAATAGGATVVGAATTIGAPTAIIAVIIIVIIAVVVMIGPLLKLGKFGHIENNPTYVANAQIPQIANKYDDLKKYLGEDVDRFKKEIENIKSNATGKNKAEIEKLCDELLKDADELKGKTADTPEDKKKKEELKDKIMDKVKTLMPLISDVVGIAAREIGVCQGTKDFSNKRFNNGSHWCAAFVKFVFNESGITLPNTDLAPNLYCEMQKDTNKYTTFKAGEGTPQPGDIVFFGWGSIDKSYCNDEIQHVGIVVNYDGGNKITTIEGNTSSEKGSSCVAKKDRTIVTQYGASGARFFARVK